MKSGKKIKLVFIQPNSPFVSEAIPLGLGYLAATAKRHGAEVKIIDGTAPYAKYTDEDMVKICRDFSADAVGVVFMTSHIYKAYELTKKLAELKIPIIGGGYHATKFPEELLDHDVDIVMRGETDITITEIIDYLKGDKKLSDVLGISYINDGEIVNMPLQKPIGDLNTIPLPDREAFNLEDFARSQKELKNVMSTIVTSRGCPFGCTFCASQRTGYRYRSAENVINEIRQVKEKYETKNFYFVDDTINVHRERLVQLCKALKGENIIWRCNGRYDLMDKELLRLMKDSGCANISFGVESGDDDVLKRINKRLTVNEIKEKAKMVHEVGIGQTINFMFGFPFEEPENIENTIKLIKELEPYASDVQRAGLLIPFPGTILYDEFKEDYNYDKWWLRPQEFMTEVRQSEYRPLFKKVLFDDLGLLEQQGRFFTYSDEVKKKIRKGICVINKLVIKRKAQTLNFTKYAIVSKLIEIGMNSLFLSSKILYTINPDLERKVIHQLYYAIRRSKYYLKNRIY